MLLLLAFARPAAATDVDEGLWAIFSTTDAFHTDTGKSRWRYWFDGQARYFDLGSGINQYLLRPGIGYSVNDNLSAWLGYARFRARGRSGNVVFEDRYWQQLSWRAGEWRGNDLSLRARLEQRSIETGDDTGLVLRLQLKGVRPLSTDGGRYLAVSAEPFVDLRDTDWGGESGLGQHRLTVVYGARVNDVLTIEAGYMNQYIFADAGEDRMNHTGIVNFKVRLQR